MGDELTVNQATAKYAAERLRDQIKDHEGVVSTFLDHVKQQNLTEALLWRGDEAVSSEVAADTLGHVLQAMLDIAAEGDSWGDAIRVLTEYQSRVEQRLLEYSPDMGSGPMRVAVGLARFVANQKAHKSLRIVLKDVRQREGEIWQERQAAQAAAKAEIIDDIPF